MEPYLYTYIHTRVYVCVCVRVCIVDFRVPLFSNCVLIRRDYISRYITRYYDPLFEITDNYYPRTRHSLDFLSDSANPSSLFNIRIDYI